MNRKLRAPAVPLVTVDPYFNVWSMATLLNGDYTRHWTGAKNSMTGILQIDGIPYMFAGMIEHDTVLHSNEYKQMAQTGLEISPLSSTYTFLGGGVELKVEFTTPLLAEELDILSRPVSYVTFTAASEEGKAHNVSVYFDITGEWCVDNTNQKVKWGRSDLGEGLASIYMGSDKQDILGSAGDDKRIDWGFINLAAGNAFKTETMIGRHTLRTEFIRTGRLIGDEICPMPAVVNEEWPVLASVISLGNVGNEAVSAFLVLAYDDIFSVEYFGRRLQAFWRKNGTTFDEMLAGSIKEYSTIMAKCHEFDQKLVGEGLAAGGDKYAELLSLSYRQAIAAHKLVTDENGEVLFFSKENFSNGCMGTVDVSYPSIPLFLLYNTELAKGMLRPIFKFSGMERWRFDFAPHDVGCYPKANGQVYGLVEGEFEHKYQMPVEECGNMLIMTAAICFTDDNAGFAEKNWVFLTKWANYLKENGLDPENQLCTDDFAGHLAHNANLSIKAIIGIGAYSLLSRMLGKTDIADEFLGIARKMAYEWEVRAGEEDHYKLAFNTQGSWSMKYNLIWDEILDLNIFSTEIKEKETRYYITKLNQYGLPLDSRNTYTKSDWIVWVASLTNSSEYFHKLVDALWSSLDESPSRVPFTDWYDTVTGRQIGFQNRSVVGGVFIKLLKEKLKNRNMTA